VNKAFQIVLQDIHKLSQKYAKLDEQRLKQPTKQTVKLVEEAAKKKEPAGCCDF